VRAAKEEKMRMRRDLGCRMQMRLRFLRTEEEECSCLLSLLISVSVLSADTCFSHVALEYADGCTEVTLFDFFEASIRLENVFLS